VRKSLLTILILFSSVILISWLIAACKKEGNTDHLTLMSQEIPTGFPAPVLTYSNNPLTKEGFELGRKLFYDGRLSIDSFHPCSSCHQQIAAFGTFEHDRSHGVHDSHTLRNAPVLFNLAWAPSFEWDDGYTSLEDEAAAKIHSYITMDENFDGVINRLNDDKSYRDEFKKVFHYPFIKPEHILKALAQFTGYLVSSNSKFDKYKRGEVILSVQEDHGYQLYKANCATCHPEPLFTDFSLRNIGLPVDPFLKDYGRLRITGKKEDSLKFKVPTLRNVYISSNYMHDGRFNTLLQCLNHYRTGVQQSATLDPLLRNGITLTNAEANDLSVFLRTLTDSTFLRDSRFAKPN
jgi:cytochrome c peroxidase